MKTKYYISGTLLTVAIILLHYSLLYEDYKVFLPIIIILFNIPNFILAKKGEFTRPIQFKNFKFNVKDFFSTMTFICGIALFIIIFLQLPEEKVREIAGKWYFLFALWLFMVSGLITRYINEKNRTNRSS